MRKWQVGDPIGDGNDIGVPDIPYMDYLKNNTDYESSSNSKQYQQRAWNAYEDNRSEDALKYINKAIDINPHDEGNWNIKGIILENLYRKGSIYEPNDVERCYNKALDINPNNKILKLNKAIFAYPLFLGSWILINIKCLIKPNTTWEKIEHIRSVDINEISEKI